MPISPDAVLALAPDAASITAASAIASPARWRGLAAAEGLVWGQVQGSALYRVGAALEAPGFTCSCPSPKVPCKHALALLLVYSRAPEAFATAVPPGWLVEWDARRRARTARRERGEIADPEAQARRLAEREARILAGLDDLERWLGDLLRQGLASVQGRPYSFWDGPAARLVDAQAPGLARRVRALAGVAASGPGWPERLLERIALTYLLVSAYRREASLPPDLRAEVRQLVGWTVNQEELLLLTNQLVSDRWRVLGQRVEEDERFRTQRTWLRGSSRWALVLTFAAAGAPIDRSLRPGTTVDADLVFFPGVAPVRALVKSRRGTDEGVGDWRGDSLDGARAGYAAALAASPWLDEAPVALGAVVPVDGGVRDRRFVPYARRFERAAALDALAGGRPVGLFGEWNGATLLPLGVHTGERYVPLDA